MEELSVSPLCYSFKANNFFFFFRKTVKICDISIDVLLLWVKYLRGVSLGKENFSFHSLEVTIQDWATLQFLVSGAGLWEVWRTSPWRVKMEKGDLDKLGLQEWNWGEPPLRLHLHHPNPPSDWHNWTISTLKPSKFIYLSFEWGYQVLYP